MGSRSAAPRKSVGDVDRSDRTRCLSLGMVGSAKSTGVFDIVFLRGFLLLLGFDPAKNFFLLLLLSSGDGSVARAGMVFSERSFI